MDNEKNMPVNFKEVETECRNFRAADNAADEMLDKMLAPEEQILHRVKLLGLLGFPFEERPHGEPPAKQVSICFSMLMTLQHQLEHALILCMLDNGGQDFADYRAKAEQVLGFRLALTPLAERVLANGVRSKDGTAVFRIENLFADMAKEIFEDKAK